MHPIDIAPREDRDQRVTGGGSGFWAILALVAVVALVMALMLAFTDGGVGDPLPANPTPNRAPLESTL